MSTQAGILKVIHAVADIPNDPAPDESLFDSGTLDSFTLPDLVTGLEKEFDVKIPDADLVAFQDHVAGQDRAIVESQRPELLPLDLQAELHLRSDRMAIAYRKWLREIGFKYGVA